MMINTLGGRSDFAGCFVVLHPVVSIEKSPIAKANDKVFIFDIAHSFKFSKLDEQTPSNKMIRKSFRVPFL